MSVERRREISAMGGKRAQQMGVAYRWNPRTGAAAGSKGGRATRRARVPLGEPSAS